MLEYDLVKDAVPLTIELDGKEIVYHKKQIRFSDCDENSGDNTVFAEYYILDMTNDAKEAFEYLKNGKHFSSLQKAIIGDKFLYERTDLRFNMYLIIIVESLNNIEKSIQSDLHSIKKVILDKENADKFFNMHTHLKHKNAKASEADKKFNEGQYLIKRIKNIKIEKYNNIKNKILEFGKINLLVGLNGGGKTSIISTIKIALTNDIDACKNGAIKLTCENKNGKELVFPCKDITWPELANIWYATKPENESPYDLFCIHNYCSMEDSSNFPFPKWEMERFWGRVSPEVHQSNLASETAKKELRELHTRLRKIDEQKNDTRLAVLINAVNEILGGAESPEKLKDFADKVDKSDAPPAHKVIFLMAINSLMKNYESVINQRIKWFEGSTDIFNNIYLFLTFNRDYSKVTIKNENETIYTKLERWDNYVIDGEKMSAGQRVCYILSIVFANFLSAKNAPRCIILDVPDVFLDAVYRLNLLDVLRQFSISGTQIFFTTHDRQIATLFRRKFSFFKEEFKEFHFDDSGENDGTKIFLREYIQNEETPVKNICL